MISIILMVWNYRHPAVFQKPRQYFSFLMMPVIYAAHAPFGLADYLTKNVQSHSALLNENTTLQAQVMLLQGQLQKFQSLQSENETLRGLLKSSSVTHHLRLKLAKVIATDVSPYAQEIILNQGKNSNVFVNQSVLDAHGIMGQVIEVMPNTSRVLLLTDIRSGIPIQNSRTGLYGILMGQGNSSLLSWINVPLTADIKAGDVLLSSGLGGHYPVGYPVGVVTRVNSHTSDQFLDIQVMPSAQNRRSTQVLLVWTDKK